MRERSDRPRFSIRSREPIVRVQPQRAWHEDEREVPVAIGERQQFVDAIGSRVATGDRLHHLAGLRLRADGDRLLILDEIGPLLGDIDRVAVVIHARAAKVFEQLALLRLFDQMNHSGHFGFRSLCAGDQANQRLFNLLGLPLEEILQRRLQKLGGGCQTEPHFLSFALLFPQRGGVDVDRDLSPERDELQLDRLPFSRLARTGEPIVAGERATAGGSIGSRIYLVRFASVFVGDRALTRARFHGRIVHRIEGRSAHSQESEGPDCQADVAILGVSFLERLQSGGGSVRRGEFFQPLKREAGSGRDRHLRDDSLSSRRQSTRCL